MNQAVRPAPGMLLVGAASRNAGKTVFLERVVRRLSRDRPVIAVKATVIRSHEGPGGCARGGVGCGVCQSLGSRPFIIQDETGDHPDKDTARLLHAGASESIWARIAEAHMAEARDALLSRIGGKGAIVCESNTFRLAVEPDLFLVMRRRGEAWAKDSCRKVQPFADREILSDGVGWDLDPDFLGFDEDGWILRSDATAIVMAGGLSTRMGRDKAMIEIAGTPLISRLVGRLVPRFIDVLISAREAGDYAFLGRRVVPDRIRGQGPLHGLACAIEASDRDVNLVVPCDLPHVPQHMIARLLRAVRDADAAMFEDPGGRLHPLFAAYRRSVLPAVLAALDRGDRRMVAFHDDVRVRRIPLAPGEEVPNLNTPESLEGFVS